MVASVIAVAMTLAFSLSPIRPGENPSTDKNSVAVEGGSDRQAKDPKGEEVSFFICEVCGAEVKVAVRPPVVGGSHDPRFPRRELHSHGIEICYQALSDNSIEVLRKLEAPVFCPHRKQLVTGFSAELLARERVVVR